MLSGTEIDYDNAMGGSLLPVGSGMGMDPMFMQGGGSMGGVADSFSPVSGMSLEDEEDGAVPPPAAGFYDVAASDNNDATTIENEAEYSQYTQDRTDQDAEFSRTRNMPPAPPSELEPVHTKKSRTLREHGNVSRPRGHDKKKAAKKAEHQRHGRAQRQRYAKDHDDDYDEDEQEEDEGGRAGAHLRKGGGADSALAEQLLLGYRAPHSASSGGSSTSKKAHTKEKFSLPSSSSDSSKSGRHKAVVNVIVLSLMVVFALGLHGVVSRYLGAGIQYIQENARPETWLALLGTPWGEAFLRLLYPALAFVLIWVIKVHG